MQQHSFLVDTLRTDFYTFVSCNNTLVASMSSYSGRVDDGKVRSGGKGRDANKAKASDSGERESAPRATFGACLLIGSLMLHRLTNRCIDTLDR